MHTLELDVVNSGLRRYSLAGTHGVRLRSPPEIAPRDDMLLRLDAGLPHDRLHLTFERLHKLGEFL